MSIMREYKLILLAVIILILPGCGGSEKPETTNAASTQTMTTTSGSDEEQIRAVMKNMMDRLWEGDKTALYENEFSYYRDKTPLSEYYELHKVYNYIYDTIRGINIDSVKVTGDSARVFAQVIYESRSGKGQTSQAYAFSMYKFTGKWIKPYMSMAGSKEELEYLENLRRYKEETGDTL